MEINRVKKNILTFLKHPLSMMTLLVFLFVLYFYHPILLHPNKYLFNDKGDAIKNYYCFQWHVHNDSSLINYTGTNYPYGEHHGYTDGTPLLSNLIKILSFLKPYSIAIFNLSLLLSFFLCAVFTYRVLEKFGIPKLLMIISSVGITVLCPQVIRLGGHFALSYSFVIPLCIFLLFKYEESPSKNRLTFILFLTLLLVFFTHQYLGMICSSFIFLYWIFRLLTSKQQRPVYYHFIIQSVAPAICYLLYMKVTDAHTDRPTDPYGFLYYTANIESVFISTQPPFRHFLSLLYKIRIQNWEGISYVGVTSLITIFFLVFFTFKYRRRLRHMMKENLRLQIFICMFSASLVLLLFSMGLPFKWNLEWLLNYLSLIKQFRAPGRFAWVFYFMMTILASIIISKYFFKKFPEILRLICCGVLLLLFIVEAVPFHKMNKSLIVKNSFDQRYVETDLKPVIAQINADPAQAIIPLPFFHIGTDIYDTPGTDKIRRASFIVSYHTKTPLLANLTPRVSLSESKKMLSLFENNGQAAIKQDLKPGQPFYVLYSKEDLPDKEKALYSKGTITLETGNYQLKKLEFKDLFP